MNTSDSALGNEGPPPALIHPEQAVQELRLRVGKAHDALQRALDVLATDEPLKVRWDYLVKQFNFAGTACNEGEAIAVASGIQAEQRQHVETPLVGTVKTDPFLPTSDGPYAKGERR